MTVPKTGLTRTCVEIDPNVCPRGRSDMARARLSHADGPVAVGEPVLLYQDDVCWDGRVAEITDQGLIYFTVDWSTGRDR